MVLYIAMFEPLIGPLNRRDNQYLLYVFQITAISAPSRSEQNHSYGIQLSIRTSSGRIAGCNSLAYMGIIVS